MSACTITVSNSFDEAVSGGRGFVRSDSVSCLSPAEVTGPLSRVGISDAPVRNRPTRAVGDQSYTARATHLANVQSNAKSHLVLSCF